jgi:choline dehydrogenase-like flavoprotein
MIRDLAALPVDEHISSDVVIVGAGPAGIALARELDAAGLEVVLLESGGRGFERATHDLNRGEVDDAEAHGPLEAYRRRCFGGATAAWGGRCAPFDEVDFEARPHVPASGWPITRADLDPFYEQAHDYCELGPFRYSARAALPAPARHRPLIPGLSAEELTTDQLYLFSPPTDFGARFAAELGASRRLRVYLHADCRRLATNREGTAVTRVEAASLSGRRLVVSARRVVLAAGGLEVTRLLLRSTDVHAGGLGNHAGLLGRFYMCHLVHRFEVEVASPDLVWDYERTTHGAYCQRTLAVRPERQQELGLLNHRARFEHPDIADPTHRNGVLSAAYLAKSLLASPLVGDRAYRAGALSRGVLRRDQARAGGVVAHLGNVARDAGGVLRFGQRWMAERVLGRRKLPSIALRSASGVYTLRLDAEQAPSFSSRVTLGDERDAFGGRRLHVAWRSSELDAASALRASALIGAALERCGAGRVRRAPAFTPEATGGHHAGTTRMAASPSRGVVDEACRVHGLANLYIASASVFPTSSYANPTLTVLALALRLARALQAARPLAEVGRGRAAATPAAADQAETEGG